MYLAGVSLDDDVSTLAEGRALHGVGEGGSGGDGLEGLLVLWNEESTGRSRKANVSFWCMLRMVREERTCSSLGVC